MKLQTIRIFTKKINNLVNDLENYISLNQLLYSNQDALHKKNLESSIKKLKDSIWKKLIM